MELYTMNYVLAVADCGNFSLAAQACHVGQPALSQQIAKLERELGLPLFYRNSRGATLTDAGKEFVLRAREIVQRTEALEAEMAFYAGLHKGSLTLGIITSLQCIDFGEMLSSFCYNYPDISVNIIQEGTHRLVDLLLERKIDLAFLNRPLTELPQSLDFAKLGEDCYSLAVPSRHPLAGRKTVSLKELKDEHFIFHQSGQVASELCLLACRNAGFEPDIVCRSGSPTTGLYMVQGGLGVAFLPSEEFLSRNLSGVVELKIEEKITKEVGIAWRRDASSPLLDAAVRFAKGWVSG
ncbi:LysR family transcriptional regulator [[Clostridium] symbiosum]|uniref:LysR family transcriptional regulator n=1 Tax=Clostridium symbiosum TaxID=1512 RepID=UPI001D082F48|nr:LysR family transcriptional regulator [[Clostridium] symbiosum]MCB6610296.1 LysR family transcriptional regulator [[Clostridium] symbiosum]MCB6932411.1 LysR family transcriptional regulator [[Clostridium] symbiosum]